MGLLDELKKLTKPYDDEDYLEEDLAEPVRAPGRAADARSYASYAEAPRSAEPVQPTRRPYVFSNQRAARQQQAADPYAQQDYGYAQQGYAQQGYAPDPYARSGYAPDPYAQQGYAAPARPQSGGAQPKLLLVHPDRFEQAADIADRIAERNAIVLQSGDRAEGTDPPHARLSLGRYLCARRKGQEGLRQHLHHHPRGDGLHG